MLPNRRRRLGHPQQTGPPTPHLPLSIGLAQTRPPPPVWPPQLEPLVAPILPRGGGRARRRRVPTAKNMSVTRWLGEGKRNRDETEKRKESTLQVADDSDDHHSMPRKAAASDAQRTSRVVAPTDRLQSNCCLDERNALSLTLELACWCPSSVPSCALSVCCAGCWMSCASFLHLQKPGSLVISARRTQKLTSAGAHPPHPLSCWGMGRDRSRMNCQLWRPRMRTYSCTPTHARGPPTTRRSTGKQNKHLDSR